MTDQEMQTLTDNARRAVLAYMTAVLEKTRQSDPTLYEEVKASIGAGAHLYFEAVIKAAPMMVVGVIDVAGNRVRIGSTSFRAPTVN
mgnify:CR=1 FL=1